MLQRSFISSIRSISLVKTFPVTLSTVNYTTQKKTDKPRRESQRDMVLPNEEKNILTYKSYKVPQMHKEVVKNMDTGKQSEKKKVHSKPYEFVEPKNFRDGYNGTRLMKYPNGNIYEGSFLKGQKSGKGKMVYTRGNVYEGDWNRDVRDGYGIFTLKDGKQYEGEWVKGKQEGAVIVRFTSGDVLTGSCHNDKLEGHGTIAYANGDHFEGLFSKGYKNGGGVLTKKDGTKQVGVWKDGKYRPLPPVPTSSSDPTLIESPKDVIAAIRNSFTPATSSATDGNETTTSEPVKKMRGIRIKKEYIPLD